MVPTRLLLFYFELHIESLELISDEISFSLSIKSIQNSQNAVEAHSKLKVSWPLVIKWS